MKKVTTRQFQLNQSKYLKELPVVLTKYGKKVAFISKYSKDVNKFDKKVINTPKDVKDRLKRVGFCKHGYLAEFCKSFKCRKT